MKILFANLDGFHLLFIALAALIAVYLTWRSLRKYNAIRAMFSERSFAQISGRPGGKSITFWSYLLLLISFALLLLALLRPQWGEKMVTSEVRGVDIVFTLDVSQSMRAVDFARGNIGVNRLEMSKKMITKFVQSNPENRFGLIIFAGNAFTISPLTLDHDAFLTFLDGVDFRDIEAQGTNLAEALDTAINRFLQPADKDEIDRGKMILVITDGEEQEGDYEASAKRAAKNNIPIVTVGIGTKQGSLIPVGADSFGNSIYKKYKGELVRTKLNDVPLKKIAEIADGKYFHPTSESEFLEIEEQAQKLNQSSINKQERKQGEDRYQILIFLSFALFLLALLLPRTFTVAQNRS